MNPIRILYVNGGIMDRGGISAYMMNYYRHIDKSKIQIDFVVHGFEKGIFDDEICELGGKIYNIPLKSKDYFGNINALRKIFASGNYKIVHSHMDAMGALILKIAKGYGIELRIAHSHNTQHTTNNKLKILLNEYARIKITKYATHYFACSELAARWLFGNKIVDNNEVTYVKNAIDYEKYLFNQRERDIIRNELNISSDYVIGHIGRFDYQKNHDFILDIFNQVTFLKSNVKLLLVGDGHLRNEIEKKIDNLGIKEKVLLLGNQSDVHKILNSCDVFILPSLFEGLGIVLIEAQTNGLNCIVSSTIPGEANISKKMKFLDLTEDCDLWAKTIINVNNDGERKVDVNMIESAGYSIKNEAIKLQNLYLKYLGEIR